MSSEAKLNCRNNRIRWIVLKKETTYSFRNFLASLWHPRIYTRRQKMNRLLRDAILNKTNSPSGLNWIFVPDSLAKRLMVSKIWSELFVSILDSYRLLCQWLCRPLSEEQSLRQLNAGLVGAASFPKNKLNQKRINVVLKMLSNLKTLKIIHIPCMLKNMWKTLRGQFLSITLMQ